MLSKSIKKSYTLSTFPPSNQQNFEDSGKVLAVSVSERICQANQAGKNGSFIFTACVKSVPRYHFKLAYVVLQMAVKEFFENHF